MDVNFQLHFLVFMEAFRGKFMMYIIFDLNTLCFFVAYSTAGGGFPSLTFWRVLSHVTLLNLVVKGDLGERKKCGGNCSLVMLLPTMRGCCWMLLEGITYENGMDGWMKDVGVVFLGEE